MKEALMRWAACHPRTMLWITFCTTVNLALNVAQLVLR